MTSRNCRDIDSARFIAISDCWYGKETGTAHLCRMGCNGKSQYVEDQLQNLSLNALRCALLYKCDVFRCKPNQTKTKTRQRRRKLMRQLGRRRKTDGSHSSILLRVLFFPLPTESCSLSIPMAAYEGSVLPREWDDDVNGSLLLGTFGCFLLMLLLLL